MHETALCALHPTARIALVAKPNRSLVLLRRGKFLHYKDLKKMIKMCRNDRQRGIDPNQMEENDRRFFKQLQVEVKDINTCGSSPLCPRHCVQCLSIASPSQSYPSLWTVFCHDRRQVHMRSIARGNCSSRTLSPRAAVCRDTVPVRTP